MSSFINLSTRNHSSYEALALSIGMLGKYLAMASRISSSEFRRVLLNTRAVGLDEQLVLEDNHHLAKSGMGARNPPMDVENRLLLLIDSLVDQLADGLQREGSVDIEQACVFPVTLDDPTVLASSLRSVEILPEQHPILLLRPAKFLISDDIGG